VCTFADLSALRGAFVRGSTHHSVSCRNDRGKRYQPLTEYGNVPVPYQKVWTEMISTMSETFLWVQMRRSLDIGFSVARSRDLPTGQGPQGATCVGRHRMFLMTNVSSSEQPFGLFSRDIFKGTSNSQYKLNFFSIWFMLKNPKQWTNTTHQICRLNIIEED
jgi:hypothetical protein